jgi:hypothetical protein
VAEATRVNRRILCRVLKEGKNVENGVTMALSTVRKLKPNFALKVSQMVSMRLF